jgi:hypothetical protein
VLCEKYLGLFTVLAMVCGGCVFAYFLINTLGVFIREKNSYINIVINSAYAFINGLCCDLFWTKGSNNVGRMGLYVLSVFCCFLAFFNVLFWF